MRVVWEQTFDDFKEAQDAHAAASSRPRQRSVWLASSASLGCWALVAALFWFYPPFAPVASLPEQLIVLLIIPAVPWVCRLFMGYLILLGNGVQQTSIAPWERKTVPAASRARASPMTKPLLLGLGQMALSIALTALGLAFPSEMTLFPHRDFLISGGVSMFPFAIYLVYGALLQGGSVRQQTVRRAWERRSQPLEHVVLEIDQYGAFFKTPVMESRHTWTSIKGLVETKNLFLLYHGPTSFTIVPKRAMESTELADAFRNMVTTLAGKQPSAFPVLPVASAT